MKIDEKQALEIAENHWHNNKNCAEVVVQTFCDLGFIDEKHHETLKLTTPGFGAGLGKTLGDCGALSGAIIILSTYFSKGLKNTRLIYKKTGKFSKSFLEDFESVNCGEIRKIGKIKCKKITLAAVSKLVELINSEEAVIKS